MTTWFNKIKQLLIGFLATHDRKYIVTNEGKKILLFDFSFINKNKAATSFTNLNKL